MAAVVRLSCAVNNYHWGKRGLSSKAAQFAAACNPGAVIDAQQPYAELWMGTHPSGPSRVLGSDTELAELIAADPAAMLGPAVAAAYGGQLPFLFKVLSIEKALSIQAHPDKALAQQLHRDRPGVYKDGNHKPEMAVALTEFTAMSGFRPLPEIARYLDEYPELRALVPSAAAFQRAVGGGDAEAERAALKTLFAELMTADAAAVGAQLARLLERTGGSARAEDRLARQLSSEYPGDVGVFCVFVLNVLRLAPGEAFFMGPNDPHAYVSGDCVECMATSDNVVRAGLTPKLRDVPVLLDMLTYAHGAPDAKLLRPAAAGASLLYDPPIDEFSVLATRLAPGCADALPPSPGPRILIATEGAGSLTADGEAHALAPGAVFFVRPGTAVTLAAAPDQPQPLVTYTAQC
ncbi:Mannose-6-phosphate isomerase [Coemansia javaensis]|uniref:Mannose-6-phosphate isomerase n=1 Tax=Coemansia javaensis TaxID=2761396 RepID=A0A9W8LEV5_9FUNG|nr:Mannose-6-phosphate isomerase [Coemansia javaensis]